MIKCKSCKTGFTLIEMVLVIAIIIILASVFVIGVSTYINRANQVSSNVSSQNQDFESKNNDINDNFVSLGY